MLQSPRTLTYVEEAFRLIQEKPNVRDIVILNDLGHPVKSTMSNSASVEFAGLVQTLRGRIDRGMQKIDPTDELLMLRIRTKFHEILVTPDAKITVIVVQSADDKFENELF
ncbi:dynein light chain roadblock-type 2 [Scaptodrosophila lebanonensis]|uniref:Dynein light chain roadblock-type 2 n=1 Tax=Drosophila lebanonensis TaxID=7225 RepID=A0A6J2U215_DROLE|nr:dynein light chain roadblock-type 2 [Scaptodrosophila lebanonensis]